MTPVPVRVWLDNVFLPAGAVITSAPVNEPTPPAFSLSQNYPNPFNPKTDIGYRLTAGAFVATRKLIVVRQGQPVRS